MVEPSEITLFAWDTFWRKGGQNPTRYRVAIWRPMQRTLNLNRHGEACCTEAIYRSEATGGVVFKLLP